MGDCMAFFCVNGIPFTFIFLFCDSSFKARVSAQEKILSTKKHLLVSSIASSLVLGTGFISTASAEENSNTEASTQLDTVVVTANRTAKSVDETVSTVKVVDRAMIEQSQARSVPDLLRNFAGIQMSNNGGRGKTSSLFIRGTNSDHVVVLIDGVKVGSATLGTVPFQHLAIEQIDRIEIVRGARSSLYGSEAIGGVIQIFTRDGGDKTRKHASVTIGAQDTFEGSVGISGGGQNVFYNLSASGTHTTGFDSCKSEAAGAGGCFNDEPDKDGYENFSGNTRLGYRFDGGSEVSVLASQTQSKNEFDGSFQNSSELTQRVLGATADLVLTNNYLLKLSLGRSFDATENFRDEVFASQFDTIRDTFTIQNDVQLSDSLLLTFGGDYQRDEVDSSTNYPENERENYGGFLQTSVQLDDLTIEASGRYDDNELTGDDRTFGFGMGYRLSEGLRVVASHGTAFKAPTFNQLYFPFFGSPDLKPEESRTTEVGIRAEGEKQSWSITAFKTEIDDMIIYDSNVFAANNIDKADIQGVEVEVLNRISDQWLATVQFTMLDPKNTSEANDGNLLPRRAKQSGRLDLTYQNEGWSAGATLNIAGTRYDDARNTRKLSAYKTIDVRAETELAEEWLLQASVENITDKNYETASFYNQQERFVSFTLRYQPK